MKKHLLATNDFPPKVGGIQNYLWELWRRLPPESFSVLTRSHARSDEFDRGQRYRIARMAPLQMIPTPVLRSEINREIRRIGAEIVVLDPVMILGVLGPYLDCPYGLVIHGAEATIPASLSVARPRLGRLLAGAELVINASGWASGFLADHLGDRYGEPARSVLVPPGVDCARFRPLPADRRQEVRRALGVQPHETLVLSVSRLVPRKGMDVFVDAIARLAPTRPSLRAAIAGEGREKARLSAQIKRLGVPVRLLGALSESRLPDLYGAADVFAMLCRRRWREAEQEGFGIVFLEAAAAGVPQVAGASGGSAEAVSNGETGLVVNSNDGPEEAVEALALLIDDAERRREMGISARSRAVREFSYDILAQRLSAALGNGAPSGGLKDAPEPGIGAPPSPEAV